MIGNIQHGSSFGGLLGYLLDESKKARIIGGNVAGETPAELAREFGNCAEQRQTTTKPVKHFSIGFAPEDGEIDLETKARIAKKTVLELGYNNNQWVAIDHHRDDPGHDWQHDHDHIHIVANMITLEGKRVDDWQDKRRFEAILRQLELEENLTVVASSSERERKAPSHGQIQRYKKESKQYRQGNRAAPPEPILTSKLQKIIEIASQDKPNLTVFIGRLQHLGVDVRPYISDKGRKRISYRLDNSLPMRGSRLHQASFPQLLTHRGIDFDSVRDKGAMEAACLGKRVEIPASLLVTLSDKELDELLPKRLSAGANELHQKEKSLKEESETIAKANGIGNENNLAASRLYTLDLEEEVIPQRKERQWER